MNEKRKIINTNIRLNLSNEADKKAWEYLKKMDRKQYKSYTKAVVTAVNDYFARQEKTAADPYLETRQKEDEFLEKVLQRIEQGVKESTSVVLAARLLEGLIPILDKNTQENKPV